MTSKSIWYFLPCHVIVLIRHDWFEHVSNKHRSCIGQRSWVLTKEQLELWTLRHSLWVNESQSKSKQNSHEILSVVSLGDRDSQLLLILIGVTSKLGYVCLRPKSVLYLYHILRTCPCATINCSASTNLFLDLDVARLLCKTIWKLTQKYLCKKIWPCITT